MKYLLANLGINLVSLASIGAAVYLIVKDHPAGQWGWFVFLAIITAGSVSFSSKSSGDQ